MLKLTSEVQVGSLIFGGVHDLEIDSSWDNLTDTCTVKFPRQVQWQGRSLASGPNPLLARNMDVRVRIGYDGVLNEVYTGLIRDIGIDTPVSVKCEDLMYQLKRGEFSATYKSVGLKSLISDLLEDTGVDYDVVVDAELGSLRISKQTPAQVLQHLREHYMLRSWFRGSKLYVGLAYVPELQKKGQLRFDRNVIESSLEWRERDSVSLLLKAVIMKPDNSKEEIEIGDKSGEVRTFHYYDIPKAEAKKRLESEEERLRYTGYRGSLTTFGKPQFNHGDIARLRDPKYPERDGSYLIKRVRTRFGMQGYRQELELEAKV